jgi:hypothetical protein
LSPLFLKLLCLGLFPGSGCSLRLQQIVSLGNAVFEFLEKSERNVTKLM